jgi:hypothetical protein
MTDDGDAAFDAEERMNHERRSCSVDGIDGAVEGKARTADRNVWLDGAIAAAKRWVDGELAIGDQAGERRFFRAAYP